MSPTASRATLLASLYLAQGLPFGFFTQALPVMMRNDGYSLDSIGLMSLLALPWALKFIWAPSVDRFWSTRLGRRRSWILPLQGLTVMVLFCLAFAGAERIPLVLAGVLVVNLLAATQDIATDGWAVELLPRSERGLANGIQVAAYRFGMVLGGGALLISFETLGWNTTFLLMAGVIVVASLPAVLRKEVPSPNPDPQANPQPIRLGEFFKRPGTGSILLLLFTFKLGDAFATGMIRPLLADQGYSLADIGWLLGTVGFLSGLVGALVGGLLVNHVGRRQALVAFGSLQALTVGGYFLMATEPVPTEMVYLLCGAEHFAGGMATAALFTCMMDWCQPHRAATDYTIQASAVVIATGVATSLSGWSAQTLGYEHHFAIATIVAVGSVAIAAVVLPGQQRPITQEASP